MADAPRSGIAPTFTAEQVCQIIALACEPPPAHWSHWTRAALSEEAVKRGIVEPISCTTIGCFWTQGQIKPHLSRYWLNHEVEDEAQFREDVRAIYKIYHQAEELPAQGIHVISVDEKNGYPSPETETSYAACQARTG